MNGPSQAQEKHMSSGFLKEESPPAATEINNALVPHQPRATAKASYMAYDEDSCDAEQPYQGPDCEVAPSKELVKLAERTTTVYADKTLMILPTDEYGSASGLFKPSKDGREQFLQIVLPLKKIKMANNGVKSRDVKFSEGESWLDERVRKNAPANQSLGLSGTADDGKFEQDEEMED